jgi:hypothetical protein
LGYAVFSIFVVEEEAVQGKNVNETKESKQQDVLDRRVLAKGPVVLLVCCCLAFYLKMEAADSL